MNKLNTRNNFIQVLVDCKGYGEEEAKETAIEYKNNLENFITDCGGSDNEIEECKEFCGITN